MNAGQALTPEAVAVLVSLWCESFSDLSDTVLADAFSRTIKNCHFWPVKVADVRQNISSMGELARLETIIEAEQKWQQVLSYAKTTSPDYPSRPIKIKQQTRAAINAAGGLTWIRDCPESELQWACKRFVEVYTAWNVLEKNQHELPDGEIKNLIAATAEKLLPESQPQ